MTTNSIPGRPQATAALLIDDETVRVTRWDFEPGAETGHHVHAFDYVVVPLTPCHFLLQESGTERRTDAYAGQPYRREAGVAHNVVNGGSLRMSFIEVEYKRPASDVDRGEKPSSFQTSGQ